MKKTLLTLSAVAALIFSSCGSSSSVQKTGSAYTPPNNQKVESMGIGPVIVSESNFYYSGLFYMDNFNPVLTSCATGMTMPIARENAFQTLLDKYTAEVPTMNNPVFVQLRGFTQPFTNTSGITQNRLVVSYVTTLTQNTECPEGGNIVGTYVSYLPNQQDAQNKVVFTILPNHQFTCAIYNLASQTDLYLTNGTWQLTTNQALALFFETENPYLSHNAVINYANTTINWVLNNGTQIEVVRESK
ncbi:MAG TPA: hypothetical protein DCF91_01480 [Porphyromonadaceae bacterium]|nr:hypothetical protein [Porphyromonadaceae bacterium]